MAGPKGNDGAKVGSRTPPVVKCLAGASFSGATGYLHPIWEERVVGVGCASPCPFWDIQL